MFSFARSSRTVGEKAIEAFLLACGALSIFTTIGIILVLVVESALFFENVSLSQFFFDTEWTPLFMEKHFGIWPLICGTVLTSVIALTLSVPAGLIIAIYLSEFASDRSRKIIKPVLEILAGIPTIVYGYFALLFITPLLQLFLPALGSFNALSAGLVMGIMILPMVASLSEDAIYTVPQNLREGAYALGASKLQMIFGGVLPAAIGGITAAFILAASRAVGETMIVAIAAGQQPLLHFNPLQPVETMTAYIVQVSLGDTPHGTIEYHTLFAVAMMLFLLTLTLNMASMAVRDRFKRMFR
ncbi:MAG: phosphate ABC transporter permease subunit PstC [Planctomycetota bacterium]|nr:MAG: phosphate ABC transporter permease subunit PstC [Planctomycetota bacterium]